MTDFNPRSDERSDPPRTLNTLFRAISIHAPTNGATSSLLSGVPCPEISIHAPTNGATKLSLSSDPASRISIHAPTNGATMSLFPRLIIHIFQSTLRRTERRRYQGKCSGTGRFQSTLRRTERRWTA